jgi:hypothetical protein
LNKIFQTPKDGNYFFGYYDKSPLDINNKKLLACRSRFFDRAPTSDDTLEIGYFNWQRSDEFHKIVETKAWNWQQGCMLQWLGPEHQQKIIYNDRVDGQFVTIILDIVTNDRDQLSMAYYSASSKGDFVLCIDNERHAWYRGAYSYKGVENKDKKKAYIEDDGVWRIDISTKHVEQIITLKQLVENQYLSNMKSAIHYVEHLMIAPNNKRFVFMHRWKTEDGGIYSRLYTVNIDGSDLYLLNDSGRMSHYCWKNNKEVVGWGGLSNAVNSLRKYKTIVRYFIKPLMPLYRFIAKGDSIDGNTKISSLVSGDSYICFRDMSKNKHRIGLNILSKDGHPSFPVFGGDLMITDTYPNKHNDFLEELILYDYTNKAILDVQHLSHNHDLARGASRCDLHPKWSTDGSYVSIDTLNDGYRAMYLYKV